MFQVYPFTDPVKNVAFWEKQEPGQVTRIEHNEIGSAVTRRGIMTRVLTDDGLGFSIMFDGSDTPTLIPDCHTNSAALFSGSQCGRRGRPRRSN